MALNVSFLKGTQNNLNKLQSYLPGSFYLTTDTDRLYFAQSDNELVYLNKYITTVETLSQLPNINTANTGDFYYVTTGNILCTKASDSATKYTQINPPDTNTDTEITGLSFTAGSKDGNIIISYTLDQSSFNRNSDNDETKLDQLTGSFTINGSDIGSVVTNVALDIDASITDNVATVVLDGTGVDGLADGVKIKAGTNVTLSSDTDHEIIINAINTEYDFTSAENSTNITLTNQDDDVLSIAIVAGTDNDSISVTGEELNKIIIAHNTYESNTTSGFGAQVVGHGGSFDIVSGILFDNGHITTVETNSVTLPSISDIAADDEGNIKITVVSADLDEATVTSSESTLYYKIDDNPVYNQAELTDYFYTKDDINNALKSANAMTFKGTVGTNGTAGTTLPTADVKIGDTYLVVGNNVVVGSSIAGTKGDMFIASGEEGESGVLSSDSITWIHVPAGDEVDTTYQFSFVKDQGLKIHDNVTDDDAYLEISSGTAINVTTDGSLDISHADVTRTDGTTTEENLAADGEKTFTVVTGVGSDNQGHITGVETTKYTMPDINYKLGLNETKDTILLINADEDAVSSIKIISGDNIAVEGKAVENTTNDFLFTISHNTNNVQVDDKNTATFATAEKYSLITGIESDEYGHLSNVEITTFTFPDTSYSYAGSGTLTDNTATITTGIYNADDDPSGEYSFSIASESLLVSMENHIEENNTSIKNTSIKLELAWGSFDN